jgi:hypothetical protein
MDAKASVRVATPSGATIHLLGVSHNSALYGKLAYDLIRNTQPFAVVLEVDEVCCFSGMSPELDPAGSLWKHQNCVPSRLTASLCFRSCLRLAHHRSKLFISIYHCLCCVDKPTDAPRCHSVRTRPCAHRDCAGHSTVNILWHFMARSL